MSSRLSRGKYNTVYNYALSEYQKTDERFSVVYINIVELLSPSKDITLYALKDPFAGSK